MNFLKAFAGLFVATKLDQEKNKLANKLQTQISTTDSDFVKGRNAAYLDLLSTANNTIIKKINENI